MVRWVVSQAWIRDCRRRRASRVEHGLSHQGEGPEVKRARSRRCLRTRGGAGSGEGWGMRGFEA